MRFRTKTSNLSANVAKYRSLPSATKLRQGNTVFHRHLSVILFTGGRGGCLADTPRQTPSGRHPPWADTPHAQCILGYTPSAQCMLGYTPRRQTIPPCSGHAGILIPPAATAADGTHPTGMHSCFNISLLWDQKLAKPSYLYDV